MKNKKISKFTGEGLDEVRREEIIFKMKMWTSDDYKKAEEAFLEMMGEFDENLLKLIE